MKKKKRIISCICLTLCVIILGLSCTGCSDAGNRFMDNIVDNLIGETESETTGNESNNNQSGSAEPVVYVDSNGYGYSTVDGITYFFKKLTVPEEDVDFMMKEPDYYNIFYDYRNVVSYFSYNVVVSWSYDGIIWNDFSGWVANDDPNYDAAFMGEIAPLSSEYLSVYVSYTYISNCTNPEFVLDDLKLNVFTVEGMFEPELLHRKKPSSEGLG